MNLAACNRLPLTVESGVWFRDPMKLHFTINGTLP